MATTNKKADAKQRIGLAKVANPILTQKDLDTFALRPVAQRKFNTGIIKFSRLYILNKTWAKYVAAILLGLFMSISTVLLVEVTGLYTGGFTACLQGVARVVYTSLSLSHPGNDHINLLIFNGLFWGLYLLLNIPLTLFAYFKISKQFAKLSVVYLVVLQGMGFVWGVIPGMHSIQIFGNTSTVNGVLKEYNVQSILFSSNVFPMYQNAGPGGSGTSYDWSQLMTASKLQDDGYGWIVSDITTCNITKSMLLLVYSVVYALISSVCYALMFIIGGSTAGSDYLTIYWSQEKNKNVGSIFIIITTISMIVGIFLGSYLSGAIVGFSKHTGATASVYTGWQYFFSANLFTSLVWVLLNGVLIDKLFPWHKLIRVEVYSNKTEQMRGYLKGINYTHPSTIIDATGGYSGLPTKMMVTICMCIELPNLISAVRAVDQNCLISSSMIADIDGTIALQKQTC